MSEPEHTFPLPPTAVRLLDEVEDELEHQSWYLKTQDYVRANPWTAIGIAAAASLLLGICTRRCAR
jgi:ElaB/YqjD/DUF883 family membrane-anchored ribosome-binding protein